MGKTLKICLAMGGGVSLGSFSGSALTESLKLLILYGKDKEGNKYDNIVLDGMSGASAGAIALTIMLKSLIDYKAMIKKFNEKVKSYNDISDEKLKKLTGTKHRDKLIDEDLLVKEIADDYFDKNIQKASKHPNIEQLKALQLAQKIQRQIWTKQLTVKNLYGKKIGDYDLNPHDSFGLLHRQVLIDSARFYLTEDLNLNLNNSEVLDKNRVVFACSLTNIVPIEIEKKLIEEIPVLKQNAFKSTGSQNHSELRVFDFVFNSKVEEIKPTDSCWFHISDKEPFNNSRNDKMNLKLREPKTWAILSSSALACGAFPFAFEPVILKRYREEYEKNYWPKVFDDIFKSLPRIRKDKSFFNEIKSNGKLEAINYDSFNFPYIDGGTFNNEPIREAFKIGSFQDFGITDKNFDRLVLFVDPAVRQEKYSSFNVDSYQSVTTDVKSSTTSFNSDLSKLIGNVGSTLGLLANQGSIKEEHRIRDAKESLDLRNELFHYIHENDLIHKKITIKLIERAFVKILKNLNQGVLSIGTRNVITYFGNELKKICIEVHEEVKKCHIITSEQLNTIKKQIDDRVLRDDNDGIKNLFEIINKGFIDPIEIEERKVLFAQTVFRVLADFSLRTVGKDSEAEYMAVLPVSTENLRTIELPGDEVEAFAGFASYPSREYAFEYGRMSALVSLKEDEDGFRVVSTADSEKKNHPIIADEILVDIYSKLKSKLLNLEFYNKSYDYEVDVKTLYDLSVKRLIRIMKKPKGKRPFSFRKANNSFFKFISAGVLTSALVLPFRKITVPWLLKLKTRKFADEIKYKKLLPITISILSKKKLSNKIEISYLNPEIKKSKLKTVRRNLNGGYQYLVQLHYLEYINWNLMQSQERKTLSESVTVNKVDPENVDSVGLAFKNKIFNPSIDNNINYDDWRQAFEKQSNKIEIKSLKIDGILLGDIVAELNDKDATLFYSLINLNYHVNPMLEFNIDENSGWYFKENTTAFYHSLLNLNI